MTEGPGGDVDAVLVVSFGGPEAPGDVIPFLQNVTRGRRVPAQRLQAVAARYRDLGGKSPLNDQCRELIAALRIELSAHGIELPIYWGNRNWHPLLPDTLATMRRDGVQRALAYVTSAFGSYSGCRQYRENLAAAGAPLGASAPRVDVLRRPYNHPDFIDTWVEAVRAALAQVPPPGRAHARVVFTAHSIPCSMAATSPYEAELRAACAWIMEQVDARGYDLVYQSRSGPAAVPWLEPDVLEHLDRLASGGCRDVVLCPLGFLSDHVEVVWDLDREARNLAEGRGVRLVRAATPGAHPRYVSMVRELIQERLDPSRPRRTVGGTEPAPDVCPSDCCVAQ
ncbi:MAG: ferrochelatase [Myxococcales bacterium]|nr:ferrochelatase [Myxococcales bacterium]MDD9967861.1 ferrochelatase [Myxococcales bacterium]